MSLFKQILSPFVEFKEDKKTAPPTVNNPLWVGDHPTFTTDSIPPATAASVIPPLPAPTYTLPSGGAGISLLPEHQQYFEKLIDEANNKNPLFQGTDFKEFIDSKMDLRAITDEPTRYRTAFNVLKRTGLTKERLLSTGQEYLNIIGREMNAFQGNQSQQYQKEVKQKELLLQKKAEELQSLSERIVALNQEITQLSQEVGQTKDKLNATKNSFLLAGENKQKEIYEELQKIAQFFQ